MNSLDAYVSKNCDPRLLGVLSFAIREAYRYLRELLKNNPILEKSEMKKCIGHIRNGLVDVAIKDVLLSSGIECNIQDKSVSRYPNGYTYLMIEVKGAILTTAKTASVRSVPKKALHRSRGSILNRQYNLFDNADDLNDEYGSNTPAYILVTYGGKNYELEYINLGLPDLDVENWKAVKDITNVPMLISKTQKKEVKDKLNLKFTAYSQEKMGELENGEKTI